jgi:uncharacterized protein YndB with AHSA1/START domain
MLAKILIGLVVVVVVAAVVVAQQPSTFRVARSAAIAAPPAQVFPQVNDLHNWEAWSPWLKADPAARTSYEGPRAGAGAVFTWSGNGNVGEGRMTITESRPNEVIRLRLDFMRPFKSTSTAEFTFRPEGQRTVVTWSMSGENSFPARAIHLFMDMDKMIGGNFEKGLAEMKAVAEGAVRKEQS